ncbi:MAG: right-handed parallel beta-helix repeat-containing protein, partial [Phycisphaerales bacterium]
MPMIARNVLTILILLAAATAAQARQHLVNAGSEWQKLDGQIKPGDEIILMPGLHKPAVFRNLQGTADGRIVIRALDQSHPVKIEADRYGLRLQSPRFVTVRDVQIEGATVCGLLIDNQVVDDWRPLRKTDDGEEETDGEPPAQIILQRVSISHTGPTGKRHALEARGVGGLRIVDCRFNAWAGSAIEIIGCSDVNVLNCNFTGQDDHSQTDGVRVRAGSARVLVDHCRFDHAAARCVSIGSASEVEDFRPPIAEDARPGSVFEAQQVTVTYCIFTGGGIPFYLCHADRSSIRNNTVLRGGPWVIA